MDLAMTDLPEPDSPTTHRISLRSMVNETPSTARGRSDQTGNATRRSSMPRTGWFTGRRAGG